MCRATNADFFIKTSHASCSSGITAISNCLLFISFVMKLCLFSDAAAPLSDDPRNEISSFTSVQKTLRPVSSKSASVFDVSAICMPTFMSLCCILDVPGKSTPDLRSPDVDHSQIHLSLHLEETALALRIRKMQPMPLEATEDPATCPWLI